MLTSEAGDACDQVRSGGCPWTKPSFRRATPAEVTALGGTAKKHWDAQEGEHFAGHGNGAMVRFGGGGGGGHGDGAIVRYGGGGSAHRGECEPGWRAPGVTARGNVTAQGWE
mgnify:CR=1 FL=1